jgi:MarR family transcriptional regulator, organic hydroperoxide resistance regulator
MGSINNKQASIARIINSIRGINNSIQKQSKRLEKSFHITGPQLGVLRTLSCYPGCSLKKLSDKMYLHVSTVTGIVDRLEASGYLTRNQNASDRRAVKISLTEKGNKVILEAPLSVFGNMIKNLQKLPLAQITKIEKSMIMLSQLMQIEDNDMRFIS